MTETKLKACPFCGKPPRKTTENNVVAGDGSTGFAVTCSNTLCCLGPVRSLRSAAKNAWNTRATKSK